ncbi:hypothetical protein DXA38_21555 [[Clostridium] innocuum]|uniref:Fibronectin type-III domain-containing protein n=1 Tax=Clostridium innocuum TaxID=1522 RepID=A0A3E2VEI1_CLOIN|nr:ZmpA/ZmpB/ZmpC family metallo-endopeptidase-related protein [[Clostridium] innocuum]RGC08980.1 hypothetical protein DXA38_21555 [[Clostridium] innocuum]
MFQSETVDNTPLGTTVSYEETGIAEQPKEEPKKEEPQEVKEIHITNEQGLKDIAKAPDKTYILDSDIAVTSDSILIEKEFTGTLEGNGHVIKGLKQPLFTSLKKANINDVNLSSIIDTDADTAALALRAADTKINGVGILAVIHSKQTAAGMLVNSTNTSIESSYVSGEITGEAGASGFVVSGNAEISNSYVTGIIEGKQSAYGFGKESSITNCYAAVYVEGKETGNFNGESSKLESSFYDISVASKEELRAQEYTSEQLVSGDLTIDGFQQTKGSYPSSKKEITDKYSEEAKKLSALSTLAVSTQTSLMGLTKDVALPSSTGKEAISWSAEGNVGVSGNAAIAKVTRSLDQDTEGTLVAKTSSGTRVMRAASAKLLAGEEPQAGQSVAEKTTSISFNMQANHYYLITTDDGMESKLPADHKAAIASGWRRYLWDGAISWDGLNWNTTYYVYEYDLKGTKDVIKKKVKTVKGQIGGSIQLSEDMAAGATLKATLKETMTTKGSWKWEKAESPTSTTWTELSKETSAKENNISSSYVLKQEDSSKYIRATFTAADEAFEGSITASSKTVVKAPLSKVQIYTDMERTSIAKDEHMVVDTKLYALVEPGNFDSEVDYTWHHYKDDGVTIDETIQGRGSFYQLQGKDVNEKICVKAVAKGEGGASGTVISSAFGKTVEAAPTPSPTVAPELAGTNDEAVEDRSITVRMPESYTEGKGLYQFLFKPQNGTIQEFDVYARGSNPVTITGLQANTTYLIYVRAIGENGHLNSDYDKKIYKEVTTKFPYVKGTLEITSTGSGFRFGDTLNATLTGYDTDQTGNYTWYLVNTDGSRGNALTSSTEFGKTIGLKKPEYIGHRLEIVLEGSGNYSGEISAQSEIIKPAIQAAPVETLEYNNSKTDTTVKVNIPSELPEGELVNIGYSKLENGVPEEYRPQGVRGVYESGRSVVISGLQRNTTYYFFMRFHENDRHEKSEWSDNYITVKTKQTDFNGAIRFEYGNAGKLAPTQTERITARLDNINAPGNEPNTKDGAWYWYKQEPGKAEEVINAFYPGTDGCSTYYEIPKSDAPGTRYRVEFEFDKDFKKETEEGVPITRVQSTSESLLEYKLNPMDKPDGAMLKVVENTGTDSTITFRMDGTEGLVYGFRYSLEENVESAQSADYDAYAGTNVTIKGLERNKVYHIWVQTKGNDTRSDSEWSDTCLSVRTKKTGILGYVEIKGTNTAGQEMEAVYNKANYMPEGSDAGGEWQWYRENDSGDYDVITGANTSKYTPQSKDIQKAIKVVYTMPESSDFMDHKEAVTPKIKKQLVSNTTIEQFRQGTDTAESKPSLDFTLGSYEGIWYRIQNDNIPAPESPTAITDEALKAAGWSPCTAVGMNVSKDYENKDLSANTTYTLYVVKAETGETQVSSMARASAEIGTVRQTGTMEITNTTDVKEADRGDISYTKITYPVIGKTITAELKNANNVQGTWKWYKSKTTCGDDGKTPVPATDSDAWEQLASGYSPTINKKHSTLTISEDLWKHYIKAEFVPNNELGYGGDSIKQVNTNYVRKIYNEQITIESSTKDGNGNQTVYTGTKVTALVENWTGKDLKGRFKLFINEDSPKEHTNSTYTENEMNTIEAGWAKEYDGRNVFAVLKVPNDIFLYVDENLLEIPTDRTYTSDRLPYRYGTPISSAEDLYKFMTAQEPFADTTANYVLTNNVNMKNSPIPQDSFLSKLTANGSFEGDYHTISYMDKPLLYGMYGKSSVQNLIIQNADINLTNGTSGACITSRTEGEDVSIKNVFLIDSDLYSNWDTGYIIGGTIYGSASVSNVGAVGGSVTAGRALGGLTGNAGNYAGSSSHYKNVFLLNLEFGSYGSQGASGMVGYLGEGKVTIDNIYVAYQNFKSINVVGNYPQGTTLTNSFFDSTIMPTAITTGFDGKVLGKTSYEMTTSDLFNGSGDWENKEGYYPRLTWIRNHPVVSLYTATRGAFTSVDNQTNNTDMFNGNINGTIKIPEELQKKDYSISSSDPSILKVTDGGTIIPVKTGTAEITITYKQPDLSIGGTASNTYVFNAKKAVNSLTSVNVKGDANPGNSLTVDTSGASGITYKWYRRKSGTTNREIITGAASNTYTIKPSDVGYEINVDVSANGYATMSSGFTDAVTSVRPTGINPENITDNSITVKAQGIEGADYEYAYATSENGNKIIAGHSTDAFTITGLTRNTTYWLFTRVAGGHGYEASDWSSVQIVTTKKTDIVGPIKTDGAVNMGKDVHAYIGDDNLQKGNWKIERIEHNGDRTDITNEASNKSDYDIYYTLKKEDVGKDICFSYNEIENGDYKNPGTKNEPVSYTIENVLRIPQNAPDKPVGNKKDAHSITISHNGDGLYDFGYTDNAGKKIQILDNAQHGYPGNTEVTINELKRNTTYYLYARLHEKEDYEPSGWSPYVTATTAQSDITGKSKIITEGIQKVENTIAFTVQGTDDDTKDLTGIWILERVDKNDDSKRNTILATTDENNPNKISYQLKPEDAGYKIKATFKANGDYTGECSLASEVIANAEQSLGKVETEISNIMQYQMTLKVTDTGDQDAIFEFGYRKHSETDKAIQPNNVSVTWKKDVVINELSRNTEYDFFIRKAEKIGYNASDWTLINKDDPKRTLRSPLLGNINVISASSKPGIDTTLSVAYVGGVYPDKADDTTSGTWQWYLDGVAVDGETNLSFTVPPVDGNPKVTVRYSAKENSDFSSYTERSFGNVFKTDYATPFAPIITPLSEDPEAIGSMLHIVSAKDDFKDIYYYVQSANIDELPALEVSEAVNEKESSKVNNESTANSGHWIKATAKEMDIRLEANKSYVVYVARLESRSYAASGINSARPVRTEKEPIARKNYDQIEEENENVEWKTLQSKTVKYTVDGKAPTVSWKYYVASEKDDSAVWQNIDADMKALDDWRLDDTVDGYARSRFQIPLKYTGQYLKIVMTGIDDYSGTITYITTERLKGALIKGKAQIKASVTTKVLDTLEANYDSDQNDKNGTFTWYRQEVDENGISKKDAVVIPDSKTNGNVSTYALTAADLNHRVFAVYTAAENTEYVGSVQTDPIVVRKKAEQEKPNAPTKVRVNGNSIQFRTPTNYKTDKIVDIPYVQVGYLRYVDGQPVDDAGNSLTTQDEIEANIHWQSEDEYLARESWFHNLQRDSEYRLFAKFIPTAAYDESVVSDPSLPIKTEHALFDEDALVIQDVVDTRQAAARPSNIGSEISFIYSGEGYDEGEFLLHRSNGEKIPVDSDRVETNLTAKTISYSYTYTKEDVGSYITVEYKAKENAAHYQGSIKKTNSVIVTKEMNPNPLDGKYQKLKRDLDTNLILELVNAEYEYYLSDKENYVPTPGDWDTVQANEQGSHVFTNLDRNTEYYLWTRIAETDEYDPSAPDKSVGVSPEPFINFGAIEITNSTDRKTPPYKESEFIPFPDTLKKGKIFIDTNKITRKEQIEGSKETKEVSAKIDHPVSAFMKADGSATDLVYEKGSTWGNDNFAVELVFYSESDQVLASVDGTMGEITVPDAAVKMKVRIYRVNAMSEAEYTWEAMLRENSDEGITAKLKADITMITQVDIALPQKIQLTLDDQVMKQSTNNEQAVNGNGMPLQFSIDRRVVEKSEKVPSLAGEMKSTDYYNQIPAGTAYLKCSNDGSNFTKITDGAWLDTGLPNSEPAHLMRLGADAWSGYYFSGITSKQQVWNFDTNGSIENAYKFRFITEVSKEDAPISKKYIYEVKGKEETK